MLESESGSFLCFGFKTMRSLGLSHNRLLEAARLLFDEPGLQGDDMLA